MFKAILFLGAFLVTHVTPPQYPKKYTHGHGFAGTTTHAHYDAHDHNISLTDHIQILISDLARFSLNPPQEVTETVSSTSFIAIPIDSTSFQLVQETILRGWDVTDLELIATEDSNIVSTIDYTSASWKDMWIRPDGKEIIISVQINTTFNPTLDAFQVIAYTLTTPWDLTTIQYDGNAVGIHVQLQDGSEDGGVGLTSFGPLAFSDDGTRMYLSGGWRNTQRSGSVKQSIVIKQWNLSTSFDLATAVESDYFFPDPFSAQGNTNNVPKSLTFKLDGTQLFYSTNRAWDGSVDNNKGVVVFNLSSPWSIASATMASDWFKDITGTPDIDFRPDGMRFFRTGRSVIAKLEQYDVDPAWDITTATLQATGVNLAHNIEAFRFSSDGVSMYTLDTAGTIRQYNVKGPSTVRSSVDNLPTYLNGGNVRETFTEVSGLEDFEGVCLGIGGMGVVADGDVVNQLCATTNPNCVTDGKITLCNRASRLHIGWRYISDIETLDIETRQGTLQGKIKRIPSVTIRFKKSRLGLVGPDKFHLTKIKQRDQEAMGAPTTLLTGDKQVKLQPVWNSNGRIFYRQIDPLPVTILAIIPDLNLEDGPDD